MLKYILKRLGLSVLILLGVSIIIYFLIRLMPVDFIQDKIIEMNKNGAAVEITTQVAMYETYGLDMPEKLAKEYRDWLIEHGEYEKLERFEAEYGSQNEAQFSFWNKTKRILKGYLNWLENILKLDFGMSFNYGEPVTDIIRDKMGTSFAVALIATIFEFMIAIPLGITAATHQYSIRDYVVTILVMIGISLPSFFFGQALKGIFAYGLEWFPIFGMKEADSNTTGFAEILEYAHHMVLPILTIVILSIGPRMRMTRTNMLEVLNADYIRTARAKGLKESKVINKHAFRNTLIPIVTTLAGLLPSLFSGAIITEQVFALDGIGNVALIAMQKGDIPFIMGYNMFLALLSVLGVLLSDLMYAVVDPRVKLS